MKVVCVEEGVGGLMDLSFSLEKMVSAEVQASKLNLTYTLRLGITGFTATTLSLGYKGHGEIV